MSTRNTTEQRTQARRWRQWRSEEAQEHLAAWRGSGLPLGTFARQRGLSAARLRWWQKRLGDWNAEADGATGSALVPVVVSAPALAAVSVTGGCPVVVRVPGGAVVEVAQPGAVRPEWLAALVGHLARCAT